MESNNSDSRASEGMIQRDDSGSRANFGERATSHVSRVTSRDDDTDIETRLRDDDFNFLPRVLIFYPRSKKRRMRKRARMYRGKNEGSGGATRGLERPTREWP